jgi:aryl-alcohol dehydrogenase-like predicted oxidoreductase
VFFGRESQDSELFVEVGGNFLDTAVNYTNGTSEKIVG